MNIVELATYEATEMLLKKTGKTENELTYFDEDDQIYRWKEEYQITFDKFYDECYDKLKEQEL